MKKLTIILSVSIFIAGCELTPPPQPRWYKENVSVKETNNYLNECIYNVGMNKVEPQKENRLIEACMLKEGFRWGVPQG